jgi:hypothetical protein
MKIIHRIGFHATDAQRRDLEGLGVKVPSGILMPSGSRLVAFDVAEDHPGWPGIRALLQRWDISEGAVRTEFTRKEIDAARWLQISAWHHGYPQPNEDVFGYREATYDLTTYCGRCGIGMEQKAPFQVKGEPKWGKKGIMQLVWVYDELFVSPDVWNNVFKMHGVECRSVLNTKSVELKTVVQLVVEESVAIVTDDLTAEQEACSECGRTKYLPISRGFFPPLAREASEAMVKTKEYFGSGASAHKGLLISQGIARALSAHGVRGASLKPLRTLRKLTR